MTEVEIKVLELLQTHPKAYSVIMDYFTNMMVNSFNNQSVPEEFKEEMRKLGLSKERMALIIGGAPRCLFDVFDEQGLFIEIYRPKGDSFTFRIEGAVVDSNHFQKRKECELEAIKVALTLLEAK